MLPCTSWNVWIALWLASFQNFENIISTASDSLYEYGIQIFRMYSGIWGHIIINLFYYYVSGCLPILNNFFFCISVMKQLPLLWRSMEGAWKNFHLIMWRRYLVSLHPSLSFLLSCKWIGTCATRTLKTSLGFLPKKKNSLGTLQHPDVLKRLLCGLFVYLYIY